MSELFAVATITLLAVISPGGDFAIVTRNSYLYGRQAGLITAIGIASAVWIHVGYTLLGVSVLLQQSPLLFHFIKLIGAFYLIIIGIQTYRHPAIQLDFQQPLSHSSLTPMVAFKNGFVTNAFNPKTTLFVLSTFSQIVGVQTPMIIQLGYGLFMSLAHLAWFAFVATVLATSYIRERLLHQQKTVNRIIGGLLCLLGGLLMATSLSS